MTNTHIPPGAKLSASLEQVRELLAHLEDPAKLRALALHGAVLTAEAGQACRNLITGFRVCLELLRGGAISEATALCADAVERADIGEAEAAATASELADMRPKGRA